MGCAYRELWKDIYLLRAFESTTIKAYLSTQSLISTYHPPTQGASLLRLLVDFRLGIRRLSLRASSGVKKKKDSSISEPQGQVKNRVLNPKHLPQTYSSSRVEMITCVLENPDKTPP